MINATVRLVCSARNYEHITPLLRDLHWLPLSERIKLKVGVLVFRSLHGTAPLYLANELCRVADIDAEWRLRSASTSALITLSSRRSTIGDRAFFVAASRTGTASLRQTLYLQGPAEDTSFRGFTGLNCTAPIFYIFYC